MYNVKENVDQKHCFWVEITFCIFILSHCSIDVVNKVLLFPYCSKHTYLPLNSSFNFSPTVQWVLTFEFIFQLFPYCSKGTYLPLHSSFNFSPTIQMVLTYLWIHLSTFPLLFKGYLLIFAFNFQLFPYYSNGTYLPLNSSFIFPPTVQRVLTYLWIHLSTFPLLFKALNKGTYKAFAKGTYLALNSSFNFSPTVQWVLTYLWIHLSTFPLLFKGYLLTFEFICEISLKYIDFCDFETFILWRRCKQMIVILNDSLSTSF